MSFSAKVLLLAVIIGLAGAKVRYDNNEVWRVDALESQLQDVVSMFALKVWASSPSFTDVMIPPQHKSEILSILQDREITYKAYIQNVQELIDEQEIAHLSNSEGRVFAYDKYNNLTEMEEVLLEIDATNPNAMLMSFGNTFEGRAVYQMHFSTGGDKLTAYIECGTHSHEWISPATCMYGIGQFDLNTPEFAAVLDRFDVHINPVNNPDGYEQRRLVHMDCRTAAPPRF